MERECQSGEENRDYRELAEEYADLLKDNADPKTYFKKKKYPEYFENYCSRQEELFAHIQAVWEQAGEGGDCTKQQKLLLQTLARETAEAARRDVEAKKGLKKGNRQGELNLYMVTSVFPCTLKLGGEYGKELCEELVGAWKQTFPDVQLGYTSFEELNGAFRSFFSFFTGR